MTEKTYTGTVTKVVTKQFTGQYGTMNSNAIHLATGTGTIIATKITKLENPLTIASGTQATMKVEESEQVSQDGRSFTNRKIVKDGLVLTKQNANGTTTTSSTGGSFNSQGARSGMIVNNAVQMGIALKKLTLTDLQAFVDSLLKLTEYVETGGTKTTTTTTATTTKTETKTTPELADEDNPFLDA